MNRPMRLLDLLDRGPQVYRRHLFPLLGLSAAVLFVITLTSVLMGVLVRLSAQDVQFLWELLGFATLIMAFLYLHVSAANAAWACVQATPLTLRVVFLLPLGQIVKLGIRVLMHWFMILGLALIAFLVLMFLEMYLGHLLEGVIPVRFSRLADQGWSVLWIVQIWIMIAATLILTIYELLDQFDVLERDRQRVARSNLARKIWSAIVAACVTAVVPINVVGLIEIVQGWLYTSPPDDKLYVWVVLFGCLIVLAPLLAIWATLLHERDRVTVMGDDLDAHVQRWLAAL